MELVYHTGNNFGDKLNPIIFNHFAKDLFNEQDDEYFVGIGSILGLKQHLVGKKHVFSSGYAANDSGTYGAVPQIDSSYNVLCVRGPLTAALLKLDPKLAVCDGAVLITEIDEYKFDELKSTDDILYIPHHKSEDMYSNWEDLCKRAGVTFVSTKDDTKEVLKKIATAKLVIAEAMHGAIIADAYRVPWVAVKSYPFINEFKWQDWANSLKVQFDFNFLPSLHDPDYMGEVISRKTPLPIPPKALQIMSNLFVGKRERDLISQLKTLATSKGFISSDEILNTRKEKLIEILSAFSSSRNNK